jgi:hypothetical protein
MGGARRLDAQGADASRFIATCLLIANEPNPKGETTMIRNLSGSLLIASILAGTWTTSSEACHRRRAHVTTTSCYAGSSYPGYASAGAVGYSDAGGAYTATNGGYSGNGYAATNGGYDGSGYAGYPGGGYGYGGGYNPGGLGGPYSGLGVRPGLGFGAPGVGMGNNPGGLGGPASGLGVRPGLGVGGLGRGR